MFNSLEEWCTVPYKHYAYTKTSLSGDKTFTPPIEKVDYVVDKITEIVDKTGSQCISSTQIYTKDASIKVDDEIATPVDGKPREIKNITVFYDGNTGNESIRVVYL